MPDSNTSTTMKSFEEIYLSKDWSKAMDWLLVNQQKNGNAWTDYNLGVVAYKMDNLPLARYHWEKSQLEGFSYPGLQKNLNFVRQELGLENAERMTFLQKAKGSVFSVISPE